MHFLHIVFFLVVISLLFWFAAEYVSGLPPRTVDQKIMPNEAWWKVEDIKAVNGKMVLKVSRIFTRWDQQTLLCVMSELHPSDHYKLKPFYEGETVHISFESKENPEGGMDYGFDYEWPTPGQVEGINVSYLHAVARFRCGEDIGPGCV